MSMKSPFSKHTAVLLQTFRAACSAKGVRLVYQMCTKRVRNVFFIFPPYALFLLFRFLL